MLQGGWSRRVAGFGLVLAVLGLGFATDADPPFVRAGLAAGLVGLLCIAVVGWVDFGRKSQW